MMMEEGEDEFFDAAGEESSSVTSEASGNSSPTTSPQTPLPTSPLTPPTPPSSSPLLDSINPESLKEIPPPSLIESLSIHSKSPVSMKSSTDDVSHVTPNNSNNPDPSLDPPPPTSSSTSTPTTTESENDKINDDARFKMVDQDTGEVFDIRDVDRDSTTMPQSNYSLIPSKEEIIRRQSDIHDDSDDEDKRDLSDADKKKTHYKSAAKSMFKGFKKNVKAAVGTGSKKSTESEASNSIPGERATRILSHLSLTNI